MRIVWIIPASMCLLAGVSFALVRVCCAAVARAADRGEEACLGGSIACLLRSR
jgi:hypothetical protein